MQPTTLQSEYYKEIFKVEIFQGRNINSEKKNLSSRWDLNPQPSMILLDDLTTELLETLW